MSLTRVWPVAAILAPVVKVTAGPLAALDLTYHLRAGAIMLDSHALPRTDAFTFTAKGLPWLDQQWGAQVLLGWAFRIGGWLGLAATRSLLAGLILLLVYLACRARGADRRVAAWLTFASGFLLLSSFTLRPQLFGIVCFAATVWLLADRHRRPERLWLLIPLTILWANLHGTFFLGPILVGLAWLEDVDKRAKRSPRLPLLCGALLAASLINPFGIRVWSYVFDLATNPVVRNSVVEWQPPTLGSYTGVAFYLSVAIVGILLLRSSARPSWSAFVALGIFLTIGVTSLRGVDWWAVAVPVVLAGTGVVGSARPTRSDPINALNPLILGVLVAAVAVALLRWVPYTSNTPPPQRDLSYAPLGITGELSRLLSPGEPFFNAQEYGSWFEFALPANPIAVDSRIEIFPVSAWHRYADVSNGRDDWQQILDDWRIDVVVLHPTQQEALLPLISHDPGWKLAYSDEQGSIFVRA